MSSWRPALHISPSQKDIGRIAGLQQAHVAFPVRGEQRILKCIVNVAPPKEKIPLGAILLQRFDRRERRIRSRD